MTPPPGVSRRDCGTRTHRLPDRALYNLRVIPPFQGQLSTFGFADLLQWMELNRRSGRMTLVRGRDRRIVDWKDGEIAYVSGSQPRDRLAVYLYRTRALPKPVLHALLSHNFTSDKNLTRLILDGRYDTLPGLSRRVEELARRLLFEVFDWRDGSFHYDPFSPVERILRIKLRLRPQAVVFQAVKRIDDARQRRRRTSPRSARETLLEREELERRFWNVVERTRLPVEAEEGRRKFEQLREFAARLDRRLGRIESLRPVHEDSAAMLRELWKREPPEISGIAPVAALDPFLTLDLLVLANSLVVNRRRSVATAGEALGRLHPLAVSALVQRLAASEFPRAAQEERAATAVRRASVAAAVASARLAPDYGIDSGRAYALGLLHTLPYADLLSVVHEMELEPGPFRAALLEAHRPVVGRLRAEGWSLPSDLEAVLTDDGVDPCPAAALVRAARATLPDCALGPLAAAPVSARAARATAVEVNRLFEFLGLRPAVAKIPATRAR